MVCTIERFELSFGRVKLKCKKGEDCTALHLGLADVVDLEFRHKVGQEKVFGGDQSQPANQQTWPQENLA